MSNEPPSERMPPASIEAEQSVLGSLLNDQSVWTSLNGLRADHFYRKAHAEIFKTIRLMLENGKPVDLVTVSQELKERGKLEAVGDRQYVTDLFLSHVSTSNAGYYSETIKEKAFLREAAKFSQKLTDDCYQNGVSPAEIIQRVQEYGRTATEFSKPSVLVPLSILMDESIKRIEHEAANGIKPGVVTGLPQLTEWLSGFQEEELIILAAATGMGKTSLALKMALTIALNGIPTAFFSYEMSHHELLIKLLAERSRVFVSKMRSGKATDKDLEILWQTRKDLIDAHLYLARVADAQSTPEGIRDTIVEARDRGVNLRVVFIDYLQLLEARQRHMLREQAVNEIARDLKRIATEFKLSVVALAQINEDIKSRAEKRPQLSDIRESGAIKQHANVVLAVYRDVYYNPDTLYKSDAELLVLKMRMGPPGKIMLDYSAERNEYRDMTGTEDPQEKPTPPTIDFSPPKEEPEPEPDPSFPPPQIEECMNPSETVEVRYRENGNIIVTCLLTKLSWVVWSEETADKHFAGALKKYGGDQTVFDKYIEKMDAIENRAELEWYTLNLKALTEACERWKAKQETPPPTVASDWRTKLGFKG